MRGRNREILGELLLLRMNGGLGVPPVEDTEDAGSDLVVDDGFIVSADNVDGASGSEGPGLPSKRGALTDRPFASGNFDGDGSDLKPILEWVGLLGGIKAAIVHSGR